MTVAPSCPALVIHDDDEFRKSLIAALDQKHFAVTYTADAANALERLHEKSFKVILASLDLLKRDGSEAIDFLRENRKAITGGVIMLSGASGDARSYASAADETLLKPVDPNFVADRARVYCGHSVD